MKVLVTTGPEGTHAYLIDDTKCWTDEDFFRLEADAMAFAAREHPRTNVIYWGGPTTEVMQPEELR